MTKQFGLILMSGKCEENLRTRQKVRLPFQELIRLHNSTICQPNGTKKKFPFQEILLSILVRLLKKNAQLTGHGKDFQLQQMIGSQGNETR